MFTIGFLAPAFLVGGVAIAIPIALHLLRRQPDRFLPFSAVRLLRVLPARQSRRQRVHHLALLALRIAALALIVLAFARPYSKGTAAVALKPVTVVAVDVSFSMSAPGEFERARRLAREAIDRVGIGGTVALVAFADTAEVVVPPTGDRDRAIGALERLGPGAGGTRYRAALARAAAVAAGGGRVVLVTDLQRSGWGDEQGTIPETVGVDLREVTGPASNLACIDFRRFGDGAIAVVRNSGAAPRATRARLAVNGRTVAMVAVNVPARSSADVSFDVALPSSGSASVTIDDASGYQADNARYLVLDPPPAPVLLLVTGPGDAAPAGFYLERALGVGEGRLFTVVGRSGAAVSGMEPGELGRYAAVLVVATAGLDARGRATLASFVRQGGGLFIAAGADVDPTAAGELAGASHTWRLAERPAAGAPLTLGVADLQHPVFKPIAPLVANLRDVRFTRTLRFEGRGIPDAVAQFSDGSPALVETRMGKGRVLLFASDLGNNWNDLPLQPLFLPLAHEMVRYLVAGRDRPQDYVVGRLPPGVPSTPGIVEVNDRGSAGAVDRRATQAYRVAVNVSAAESDTARMPADEFEALIGRMRQRAPAGGDIRAAQAENGQQWWRYGVLLALIALLVETRVAAAAR